MLGRKKRRRLLKIWNAKGTLLFSDEIKMLEIPEQMVLRLSREFFNDPNPCEIHRSAVMTRVFMELEQTLALGCRQKVVALSDWMRACLPEDACELGIFEEERP